jgi:hypothetical protein
MEKDVDVRKNLLLENSHAMVLAACWSTLEDIETFSLFPEILSVDTTFSTNKEKLPLLMMYSTCSWCGVDALAEIMVIILRDLLEMGCSFETS